MINWVIISFDRTNWDRLVSGSIGTLKIAVITSLLLVAVSALFAFLKRSEKVTGFWKVIGQAAILGYSIPGAVIGIGVVIFMLSIYPNGLFASILALTVGMMSRFFAVAQNPVSSSYSKLSLSVDESSELLGRGPWALFSKIHFPVIRPALLAAFILVFIDVTKELPLTLILRPFNFETLSSLSFQFAKDEMAAQSALPALIIVGISAIPVYLLHRIFDRS